MTREHADAAAAIFTEGIVTGNATFESAAADWSAFDAAKITGHRLAAVDAGLMPGGPYVERWRDVVLMERRSPVVGTDHTV